MSTSDFAQRSVPLVLYSRALDSAVLSHSADVLLLSLVKRRLEFYNGYLDRIRSINPPVDIQYVFSAAEQKHISDIQHANDTQMRGMLSSVLITADQDLIGVHVLASGPVGLKDAGLRAWASVQLKVFIADLSESQNL